MTSCSAALFSTARVQFRLVHFAQFDRLVTIPVAGSEPAEEGGATGHRLLAAAGSDPRPVSYLPRPGQGEEADVSL